MNFQQLLERAGIEVIAFLSVIAWAILRVAGVISAKVEKTGFIRVEICGKELIEVDASGKHHIQREKEKTAVIKESVTQKTDNHI